MYNNNLQIVSAAQKAPAPRLGSEALAWGDPGFGGEASAVQQELREARTESMGFDQQECGDILLDVYGYPT